MCKINIKSFIPQSVTTGCGIFGSIEAAEAIKYIIGKGELLTGKLLTADALTMTFRKIAIPRDPDCPACGGLQE